MATVNGSVTRLAGDTARFYGLIWQPSGSTIFYFGAAPAEITITSHGVAFTNIFVDRYDTSGTYRGNVAHRSISPNTSITIPWAGTDPFSAGLGINLDNPSSGTYSFSVDYVSSGPAPCIYGTERIDPGQSLIEVTPDLLNIWLTAAEAPELAVALVVVYYTFLNSADLCGAGPPELPAIGSDFANAPLSDKIQLVKAVAWAHLCRCKAGSPSPTPYPPVIIINLPPQPSAPVFPCDPAAICDSIVAIRQQLAALSQTVASNYALLTLLQRFQGAFAYIRGATHSGLTGSNYLTIPRCIGVQVAVTQRPEINRELTGVPPYVFDLGWISCLTADGMLDEVRLTRDVQVWQSRLIPEATAIGYGLRDGVTVSITELYAEP